MLASASQMTQGPLCLRVQRGPHRGGRGGGGGGGTASSAVPNGSSSPLRASSRAARSCASRAASWRTCAARSLAARRWRLLTSRQALALASHAGRSSQSVSTKRCPHSAQPLKMTDMLHCAHFGIRSPTDPLERASASAMDAAECGKPLQLGHWPWCARRSEQFSFSNGPEQHTGHIFKCSRDPLSCTTSLGAAVDGLVDCKPAACCAAATSTRSASPSASASTASPLPQQSSSSVWVRCTRGTKSGSGHAGQPRPASSLP
mmetsp:Transcript_45276/g.125626  ORF Transcript_45276/g.125626 Transcript_45276/m.125626 type:complete len:261 (-) Transcript_45276:523-1305(-)